MGPRPQECLAVQIHQVFAMALDQFFDQCILAGEILVERADADAGRVGDARGARRFEPVSCKQHLCRLEDRVDRHHKATLARPASDRDL